MATNVLSIGQSALAAAQVGLGTTSHNIANASTPGYSRQVAIQGTALPQDFGFGFMGQGTQVTTIRRVYNDYLGVQMQSAQASKSSLDTYYAQIKQIDNMLADSTSGLSPSLQGFFSGIQTMASNPSNVPARQAVLSSAETLAARFQGMAGQLDEMGQGVDSQIRSSVGAINSYAQQIAHLNDAIGKAQRATGQPANDLLDQRDQLVLDLNKEIKATVVKQDDGAYNVFIGNGQPLVMGATTSALVTQASPADPTKIAVAYRANNGSTALIGDTSLAGGNLGGLLEFRSKTLEPAQNALGRVAIGLASSVNAQHRLGLDLNGNPGGDLFTLASPAVYANAANAGSATATAGVSDAGALTTSDYRLAFDGSNYTLTRLSDNTATSFAPGALPQTVDGITVDVSGTPAAGDSFLVRPTANGASGIGVAIGDPALLAAAEPGGGVGDGRNALALGALQTANTLGNGTTSFQGAYAQFVGEIGNKTRELEVTSSAAGNLLSQATQSVQSASGVNLDEEAANLLRYQQAYQAAGKVMQIASQLFDVLLSIGR
ncbi:MAG: flagellar hook-associated protein FlgK [Betaproteobacteria bacterium]|nr:flagellar hook-associated protein FlgK [Betaproteobacteria bacterium]